MFSYFFSSVPCDPVSYSHIDISPGNPGPYSSNEDAGSGGDVFAHVTWRVVPDPQLRT